MLFLSRPCRPRHGLKCHICVDAGARGTYLSSMSEIDARDLLCPLPVLRLRKALAAADAGATLTLLATDPAAAIDVPHFCAEHGHRLLSTTPKTGKTTAYTVRKAP